MGNAAILIEETRILYGGPYKVRAAGSTADEAGVLVRQLVEDLMEADSTSPDPLRIKIAGTAAAEVASQLTNYFRPEECTVRVYGIRNLVYNWCTSTAPVDTVGDFRKDRGFGFLVITPIRNDKRLNVSCYRVDNDGDDPVIPSGNSYIDRDKGLYLVEIAGWQQKYFDVTDMAIIASDTTPWTSAGNAIKKDRGINVGFFIQPDLYELLQQAEDTYR